jgi:pyrophosphatase PpaX
MTRTPGNAGPEHGGIRAVLFDFDGTLADSTDLIMQAFRHTMSRFLDAPPADDEWLSGFGTPLRVNIARFARSAEEAEAMMDVYRTFQEARYDELLRPFPGAPEMVEELARRGVPMAVVTSRYRRSTLRGMELCGMLDHIPVVVTPEDVEHAKPHPEPVFHALGRLCIDADRAVFVGDSPHDIESGRGAGVWTAGVLWGPFPHDVLRRSAPDFLLEEQRQVLDLLGRTGAHGGGGEG